MGEYLFDHRNANVSINGQTFIEWFIDEYYGGQAGIANKDIIGLYVHRSMILLNSDDFAFESRELLWLLSNIAWSSYIDDDWGNMNANGPSEMDGEVRLILMRLNFPFCDVLLTFAGHMSQDLKTIVPAYNWVANKVYHAIQQKGKWAWDLFLNNDPNCIVSNCRHYFGSQSALCSLCPAEHLHSSTLC